MVRGVDMEFRIIEELTAFVIIYGTTTSADLHVEFRKVLLVMNISVYNLA
jgi:hypothetical protein